MKQKIVALDKLVENKETVEGRNVDMSPLLEAKLKESKMVESSREKDLEKYREVWREVWKNEGEIKKREEEWKAMMEK